MNSSNSTGRRKWLWPTIAVMGLLIWTVYCDTNSMRHPPFLRVVPAFFLGVLMLLTINAAARICIGAWHHGWRWLIGREVQRLCAWTFVFAVSVVVLFYTVELWRGKRAWVAVVREAKTNDELLNNEILAVSQPPDALNFAKAPLFAAFFESTNDPVNEVASPQLLEIERFAFHWYEYETGVPFAPWLDGRETDLQDLWNFYFETNQPDGLGSSTRAPDLPNAELAASKIQAQLERLRPVLSEVRRFSSRPECWFPPDERLPGVLVSRQGAAMRGLLRIVRLRASVELALNHPDAAFEDMQFGLRLADYGRRRPLPTSLAYANHNAAVVDALQPLWEGLSQRCWTAVQITQLQRQLEELDLLRSYRDAVRADAATMTTLLDRLIPRVGFIPIEDPYSDRLVRAARLLYPTGWLLQDQAAIQRFYLETTSQYLDLTGRRIVGIYHGFRPPPELVDSSNPLFLIFIRPRVWEMYDQAQSSFPFAQTTVDLATLACALERYRLANGEFPTALDALVPIFVAKLPHDIVTGEPLKYRLTETGGFLLYSVGFNKVDDYGESCVRHTTWVERPATNLLLDKNDWVWVCPTAVAAL